VAEGVRSFLDTNLDSKRRSCGSVPSEVPHVEGFRCEVDPHRAAVHVRPVGELDIATAPVVDARLAELQSAGVRDVVLDLHAVEFLDASGLRLILRWDHAARAGGFSFGVVPGPPHVSRLFTLTGLSHRLHLVEPHELTPAPARDLV
jgi:anti-anti-sigma factor